MLRKVVKGPPRGLLMELLYRYGGLNNRETGELMGIDYSAVGVGRKRFLRSVHKDKTVSKRMRAIERALRQG